MSDAKRVALAEIRSKAAYQDLCQEDTRREGNGEKPLTEEERETFFYAAMENYR